MTSYGVLYVNLSCEPTRRSLSACFALEIRAPTVLPLMRCGALNNLPAWVMYSVVNLSELSEDGTETRFTREQGMFRRSLGALGISCALSSKPSMPLGSHHTYS